MRRRDHLLVHGFLAVQLVLPLGYYAGCRDRLDERFAWRMFSAQRMVSCKLVLDVDGRPLPLAARYHEAWIALAERGRPSVVEAMAADLCRANPGRAVHADLRCATPTGPLVLETPDRDLCEAAP